MNEEQWLVATSPFWMLDYLETTISERKLRLFGVACCRRIWQLLDDQRLRDAVLVAERYAEGRADGEQLEQQSWEISPTCVTVVHESAFAAVDCVISPRRRGVQQTWGHARRLCPTLEAEDEEEHTQAQLLREIVGNPFRPVTLEPRWRTPTIRSFATAIYNEQRFEDLPILADALEDAGCDNSDILDHCHGLGPHTRGCWVLDLILEKC